MAEQDSEERQADEIPISLEVLRLSPKEWATMMEVLVNPPEPSPRLIRAARLHSERVRKSPPRS